MNGADQLLLGEAIRLAERGRFTCAPNPTVGCIIVRDGEILGRGYHAVPGEGHAEVQALADAGGEVAGSTVYVSLEPCSVVAKTPACAATLIEAQVSRVVAGCEDPNPRVAGSGFALLREAGIEVENAEREDARRVIRGFQKRITQGLPWVRVKSASSLDGGTALASGESKWITGPDARNDVQYWRARSDAIVTGVGTVIADDPELTVRRYTQVKQPVRVVLDASLSIPADARILCDGGETLVIHEAGDGANVPANQATVEYLRHDTRDIEGILKLLAERGCNEVLVEAGASVTGAFLASDHWDEWVQYVAPKFLGANTRPVADHAYETLADVAACELDSVMQIGEDVRLILHPVRNP